MATPNYGYEKRQRELAKKQKKADKARERAQRKADGTAHDEAPADDAATRGAEPVASQGPISPSAAG